MLTRGDLNHVSKNGFSVGHVCMQEMKYMDVRAIPVMLRTVFPYLWGGQKSG